MPSCLIKCKSLIPICLSNQVALLWSHTYLSEQPSSSPLHGPEAEAVGMPRVFQIDLITVLVSFNTLKECSGIWKLIFNCSHVSYAIKEFICCLR